LPSLTDEPEEFARIVQLRLTDLLDRVQTTAYRLEDVTEAAADRNRDVRREIAQLRAEAQGTVQRIAVGGLREQFVGWLFLVAGVVLQAIGQAMQAT
jgi:hypothetical protein